MVKTDLEKTFLAAADIAKKLPKTFQEAGFNRALDQLLGRQGPTGSVRQRSGTPRTREGDRISVDRSGIAELMDAIDRTSYPDVGATGRVADRALKVLHLAHQDHGVDGLTAADIANVLSRKFRLPVKANSVTKALERETDTVDARSGPGGSRVFHIMAPGEAYLDRLRSEGGSGRQRKTALRRPASKGLKAASQERTEQRKAAVNQAQKKKGAMQAAKNKAAGRPGPKTAIGQLVSAGFFRSPRTISDIQEELQHRKGHRYSVHELSPALVRSVRGESLSRDRNEAGQYEYTEA